LFRKILLIIGIVIFAWVAWQFLPPPAPPNLPPNYTADKAVWLEITWAMDSHTDTEIEALARSLQAHKVRYVFAYVSYLKADDTFNPTFDHAARFVEQIRLYAPEIVLLAWVGVPIQITRPDGQYVDNRLADPIIQDIIAQFSRHTVNEFDFDGIHLNAEAIADADLAFIQTLQAIRAALPTEAILSLAAHALYPIQAVTIVPYPKRKHHWSADYLREVAENSDQIAIMAYDSGLFFPSDYRSWVAYQVKSSAAALAQADIHLLIGVSASDEWTPSHNMTTEYLENALYGVRAGIHQSPDYRAIDGIALYAHWEMNESKWALTDHFR
jgi:hypothetical protein